ncbi:MAG: DUF4270 family protein [Tenacibaculum sp.]|nr:DUF4270 family protein [Tenacibaculum sp.]
MIKKFIYIGAISILFSSIVSCEKDFTDVGSTIIDNDKFATKTEVFDVNITQKNVDYVRSGNTEIGDLGAYLLGVYKKENAKTIEASIVSQLIVPSSVKNAEKLAKGQTLTRSNLDAVILKIPVPATFTSNSDYKIDNVLGNIKEKFNINVYENKTYLYSLNPKDPSKKKVYLSNEEYEKGEKLNVKSVINFSNSIHTKFLYDRTLNGGKTEKDTLKVKINKRNNPFIAIELDKNKLKEIIFNKYNKTELSSQEKFNDYFKGILVEVTGNKGALIPLNFSSKGLPKPSVDFIYTNTIKEAGKTKDIKKTDVFYLGGVTNSIYKMSGEAKSTTNNIVLQGTAGYEASIKILPNLEELRKKDIIINNAILSFDVNTSAVDSTKTPNKLFLYKNVKNGNNTVPTLLKNSGNFGGTLTLKDNKPNNYTFNVLEHISDIIKGKENNTELILKVYNPTYGLDEIVKNYNWNPKSVNLLNKSTENGTKRGAKLVISYTEKK